MSFKFKIFFLISLIFCFADARNMLTKINLDNNDFLELYFEKEISVNDINIKRTTNPNLKIYDFKNVDIGNNIGKIDAMHTVAIAPNGSSMDARVLIDTKVAGLGTISKGGDIFRIKLKLNRDQVVNNDNNDEESATENNEKSNCNNKDVIVIDAGHGGKDPGAMSNGVKEKDIVLAVSKKLAKSLSDKGYRVYLTRDSDIFLTLEQRTRIADKKNAKIFISLHCNAAPNDKQAKILHGIETFFLQKTRDARSQSVAARENASVLQGADKKSKQVIVDSVLSGPKIILSHKLAIDIQNNITEQTNSNNGSIKSAPFWVLVGASRPSILVELGYLTHPVERENLLDSSYQEKLADGIADGIYRYQKNRQKEIDN